MKLSITMITTQVTCISSMILYCCIQSKNTTCVCRSKRTRSQELTTFIQLEGSVTGVNSYRNGADSSQSLLQFLLTPVGKVYIAVVSGSYITWVKPTHSFLFGGGGDGNKEIALFLCLMICSASALYLYFSYTDTINHRQHILETYFPQVCAQLAYTNTNFLNHLSFDMQLPVIDQVKPKSD